MSTDDKLNMLLDSLDQEIEHKCFELRQKRSERAMERIFMVCCVLFIIVPVTLVILGLSVITFITWAAIFMAVGAVSLSPVILKSNEGGLLQ